MESTPEGSVVSDDIIIVLVVNGNVDPNTNDNNTGQL